MKKQNTYVLLLTNLLFLFIIGCKKHSFKEVNPEFANYVSFYTSGIISSQSSIKIKLSQPNEKITPGDKAKGLFEIVPKIKGKAIWLSNRIVEFIPEKPLKSGTFYTVNFKLGKVQEVSKTFENFEYNFQVIQQFLDVQLETIKPEGGQLTLQKITGSIEAADYIPLDQAEKLFKVKQGGNTYPVKIYKGHNEKRYTFEIASVKRQKKDKKLILSWDGDVINSDLSGELSVEIPALTNFKVIQTRAYHQPEKFISILFSDPLARNQNLTGLIRIKGEKSLRYTIDGNEIKVYPTKKLKGKKILIIRDVRNKSQKKLPYKKEIEIEFNEIKPELKLLGKGIILPDNEGVKFPFKTINLKAVKVKVVKIYEDNIAQFLQVNQLDGDKEILRVGRVAYKGVVALKSKKSINYSEWNTFSLELNKLINPEPGAIYRIELSFGKKESLYPCLDEESIATKASADTDDNWEQEPEESSSWDNYENNKQRSNYDYSQRNNPCNDAFYSYNTTKVTRNVLASNFGVITKMGVDDTMLVAVTDLRSTEPVSDVNVNVINYQQQIIAKSKTNGKGLANLNIVKKPFLLIVSKGKQKGYVRLDNGSALSTSKFDVSGAISQKGVKGFLYGDRGVWRPSDTIHMNFILQDQEHFLPKNHPVTYELFNPSGQLVYNKVSTKSVGNIYNFSTPTADDYDTGNWMARVKVGGSIFSKRVKIETVKPNRLKVALDFGVDKLSVTKNNVKSTLTSKWLHGAIAKNLKADVKVSMSQSTTSFPKYKDYIFDDPGHQYESEEKSLFSGRLNAKGQAAIKANIKVSNSSPGMLKANFRVRVFEEGGDFSSDQFTIPYAPYTSFVGIKLPKGDKARGMLLTDEKHPIKIATLNAEGKPINTKVRVDLYKLEWKYWWEKNDNEDLSKYKGSSYRKPLKTDYVNSSKGEATSYLEIKYPDWGRYYVRVTDQQSGHATGKIVYIDWPGWAGRASKENPGGASMLTFTTDKQKYKVGENVNVNIPTSSEGGRALVSVESGSRVVSVYWVETEKKSTQFSFKVTKDMTPNVYINVTLIQPHQYKGNDSPIRLYGMTPISVEDTESHLSPVIEMADELHPDEKVKIKISETNKKEMAYTIAIVDEGLLDITRFKTPNPWNTFYAREALGVRSWDMYDYVMGASAGDISGLLQIGGDDSASKKGGEKANRFKPVVHFMGPFYLKKGETKEHFFTMPQYIGSVKTMVVAAKDGAYGNSFKATPVRQPLMVLSTLPRVLSPRETVKVPVNIFALNNSIKNAQIKIKTTGNIKTVGTVSKNVAFEKAGEKLIYFDLEVPNNIGKAQVEIIATSGTQIAKHTIDIQIRLPNPLSTSVIDKVLAPSDKWNTSYLLNGFKGTNEAYLEVSNMPAINLEERLKYLIQYPHGCIEQTTSSGFPQLFLEDLTELSNEDQTEISDNIKATISRLLQFQHYDGGFKYWPTGNESDDWGTSYAGNFLLEAKAKGYKIPSGVLSKWIDYQSNKSNSWVFDSSKSSRQGLLQAYRLYTLALAGKSQLGAMNRLKEQEGLDMQVVWRLAAAYAIAGQKETAREIIFGKTYEIPAYREMGDSYGSDIRDKAMILETMVLVDENEKTLDVMRALARALSSKEWMSTQTTAYALIGISKFVRKTSKGTNKRMKFSYAINQSKGIDVNSQRPILKKALSIAKKENSLVLENTSDVTLFARIITKGGSITNETTDQNNDLQMKVSYLNLDNQSIDPKNIKQGTDFKVEVTIKNIGYKGDYHQMALSQLFPSGWEIQNIRTDNTGGKHLKDTPDYMDIRDDRVHYYYDLKEGKSKTFVTLLNAAYTGRFYLPPVYSEAMYDNTINAKKAGSWIEISK